MSVMTFLAPVAFTHHNQIPEEPAEYEWKLGKVRA